MLNNTLKLTQRLIFILFIMFLSPNFISAATYYVDKASGDDSLSGECANLSGDDCGPWKTIGKANKILTAGDTVFLKAGTYQETIAPDRSGSAGEYITFTNYNNDKVVITGVENGAVLNYRSYIILDGLTIKNIAGRWVYMEPDSTHNVIQNCEFDQAGSYQGLRMRNGADYNKILNNTFAGACGPDDTISIFGGSYNLIEGNYFFYSSHQAIDIQSRYTTTIKNIIRNNIFQNKYHSNISFYPSADYTFVESNTFLDGGEEYKNNTCASETYSNRINHNGIQLGSAYCIIRKNVFINNGSGVSISTKTAETQEGKDNRIYNNTFNKNYAGIYSNDTDPVYDNIIKNNILYGNRTYEVYRFLTGSPNDNYFTNNNITGAPTTISWNGSSRTISYMETNYESQWDNNIAIDPQFVDESGRDLHLKSTSPMIDTGVWLTTITASGNGTIISVDDAGYFMDGWGLIEGDTIQLEGKSQTLKVIKVDYTKNTITIDKIISTYSGQGVSLAYKGSSPDIGAYEYASTDSDTSPPSTPAEIAANLISSSQVNLSWEPSTDNFTVAGYKIYRNDSLISTTPQNAYTDNNLSPSTTYTYSISAYDSAGNESDLSTSIEVTTTESSTDTSSPFSKYYETEDMSLIAPMTIGIDEAASGGKYISPTTGEDSRVPVPEATLRFNIPATGTYYFWIRLLGPDSNSDAIYAGINTLWDRVYPSVFGNYEWVRVETLHKSENYGFDLTEGENTFQIAHGEINARAELLFLTNDPLEIPSDSLDAENNIPAAPSGLKIVY